MNSETGATVHDKIATQAKEVAEHNEKVNKGEPIIVKEMQLGEIVRQGDLYITMIEEFPKDGLGKETSDPQMAPGTTQGSRHIIDEASMINCKIWTPKEGADVLQGNYIEAKERWCLTHPEHRHFSIPSGRFSITHQQDWSEEERRRVAD